MRSAPNHSRIHFTTEDTEGRWGSVASFPKFTGPAVAEQSRGALTHVKALWVTAGILGDLFLERRQPPVR